MEAKLFTQTLGQELYGPVLFAFEVTGAEAQLIGYLELVALLYVAVMEDLIESPGQRLRRCVLIRLERLDGLDQRMPQRRRRIAPARVTDHADERTALQYLKLVEMPEGKTE